MSQRTIFGADGAPIPRLGEAKIKAENIQKKPIEMSFEVAQVSRPLASAGEIVRRKNRVVLDEDESYIQNKKTNYKTPLRFQGNLFYLDLWVRLPEQFADDLVKRTSFARRAN